MMQTPPELDSLRSWLKIAKIFSLIFLILIVLSFLALLIVPFFGIFLALILVIPLLIQLLIYTRIGAIQGMVDAGQYVQAKERTFLWMILGFIFGGILIGLFLLLAYLKFDPVINWQRSMGQGPAQPMWGGQPQQPQAGAWGQPQPQTWGQPTQPQASQAWGPPGQSQAAPAWGQPAQPQPSQAWGQPAQPAQPSAPVATPTPAPAPAAAPAAPTAAICPRCGKPATWVAQYSRWYCYTDAQYL